MRNLAQIQANLVNGIRAPWVPRTARQARASDYYSDRELPKFRSSKEFTTFMRDKVRGIALRRKRAKLVERNLRRIRKQRRA